MATDDRALLLWVPPPLIRELRRRARRMEMLEHEIAVEVLRTALLTNEPTPSRRDDAEPAAS